MNKLSFYFGLGLLGVLLLSQTALAEGFVDVEEDSPFYTSITYFQDQGVLEGYPDGTFRPDNEARRGEAIKIVLLGSSISVDDVELDENIFPIYLHS